MVYTAKGRRLHIKPVPAAALHIIKSEAPPATGARGNVQRDVKLAPSVQRKGIRLVEDQSGSTHLAL